jgi:lipopolysaccharide/colanic/teichoic acid biosynthesis glycosyltransferase
MQRFLDVLFSALALFALLPIFLVIIIILRLSGEGEVFYKQLRVGKDGKMFGLYKFATMLKNSENMSTGTLTVKNDPRVLPVGRFLRKTKINELPQLINILIGDMSVIGPRPQDKRCFGAFPPESQQQIIKVRPGLSGIGSIVFRDEEEIMANANDPDRFYDEVVMPYKGKLEEWYVENVSLRNYLLCIFLTAWVIFFPKSSLYKRVFSDLPTSPDYS